MKVSKRLLSVFLALCLMAGLLPAEALAARPDSDGAEPAPTTEGMAYEEPAEDVPKLYDEVVSSFCGENLTWTLDEDGTLTISGTGEMYDNMRFASIISVDGIPINTPIKAVVIEEGVTSIGNYAFIGCTDLTSVTIPKSVSTIGENVFLGCTGLTSAGPIGGGYDYEFGWKTAIPDNAFAGCAGLTHVTIPEGVSSIGYSFSWCSELISVTIPESVSYFKESAFWGCHKLTTAGPIGGGYNYEFGWKTEIPENAFYYMQLTSVTIPESVTSIGDNAFAYCPLRDITIPKGMISIGQEAFVFCDWLTSVTIPESVTAIGSSAFLGCYDLTEIKVSAENPAYSDLDGVLFDKQRETLIAYPAGREGDYSIPSSVTSIGSDAFKYCRTLTSVTIPESVTSIGSDAFSSCNLLTNVKVLAGNLAYLDLGGVLFDKQRETLIAYPAGREGDYRIPSGVASIGDSAFSGCNALTSVTIPENVVSIGDGAFSGCNGLTSVIIPGSVASIGEWTFSSCRGLTSVMILEGVTSIEWGAFYGCQRLASITIPESVTSIENYAFTDCPYLCIYCHPNSYAENYAIENNKDYILGNGDNAIAGWITSNALNGVVAGEEVLIRTGYTAQNPASTLQIVLPQGIALSTVWLDGTKLTKDAYTLFSGSLTVYLAGLPDKLSHTLYLYCTATTTGSRSVSGTLTLDGTKYSLGTTVIRVEQARLNVPEKIGYTSGIIATGKANPGCGVTLFVDGAEAGHTTTNDVGSWQISFDLGKGAESGSSHTVYAEIQLANDEKVQTAEATVVYQACDVKPLKATMYNTGDHGAQETVFDFTKPEEANLVRYYRIWPSRYPSFTFKAEFSGDPSTLDSVSIVTTDSAGKETKIPAVYDPISHSWVGTHNYTSFQDAPVWVRVVYTSKEISSNKLSAVPIMDPSGYVYEAVPSNRLAGIKATISCDQDGNTPWDASAFDQTNPQVTGADGSYYWDVPAGNWKVSFTKEGYANAETDWLIVPPPQVDINVAMVSTAAPEVKCAAVYEDYAEITFSQYMNIDSVKGAVTLNGTAATVEALNAEDNAEKTAQYATRFKATAAGLSDQVELTVSAASNYAGTAMQETYTQTFSVETRPTEITAPETVSMVMSAEQSIRAALVPGIPGRTLTIENLTPAIINISGTSVTTDGDGGVEIPATALLPGTGILRITEPVSGLETTVSVQVETHVEPEISIEASIEGSVLTYRISNAPEQLNAKLIVASYINQQMGKAVIVEELSGTLELNDPSASSYALFLVEADTMKPLCSNVTVPVGSGA